MKRNKNGRSALKRSTGQTDIQSFTWLPCTVIRPHPGNGLNKIELSNPFAQKRIALSREAALEALASLRQEQVASAKGQFVLEQLHNLDLLDNEVVEVVDDEMYAGIRHWQERNWSAAINYYLWSRRWQFFDTKADYRTQQETAIQAFLEREGPPRSPRTIGEQEGITLAPYIMLPNEPLGNVMFRRTAAWTLPERQLPQTQLSSVLWYGLQGVRKYRHLDVESNRLNLILRSFGSAFEFFFVAYNVENLAPGVYFYDVSAHKIKLVQEGNFRDVMQYCLVGQPSVRTANCTYIVVADFQRYLWRYRHERALRNLYVDVSRLVQQLILVATAFKVQLHMTPAVRDSTINELLGLNSVEEQVLFTLTSG